MNIAQLAFPLVQADEHVHFKSLQFTNSTGASNSTSFIIESENNKLRVVLSDPIQYIDHKPVLEDEFLFPLLIKIPSNSSNLRLTLNIRHSDEELQKFGAQLQQNPQGVTLFEEIFITKTLTTDVRNLQDPNTVFKTALESHNVKSLGKIKFVPSDRLPTTQSLLNEKSVHTYGLPASSKHPIVLGASLNISKSTDFGKITFHVMCKSNEKLVNLAKFSVWKDKYTPGIDSTLDSNSHSSNSHLNSNVNPSLTVKRKKVISIKSPTVEMPLNDGPLFRNLLSNLEERIPNLRSVCSQLIGSGKNLENSLLSVAEHKRAFAQLMRKFSIEYDDSVLKELVSKELEPLIKGSGLEDEQLLHNLKINLLNPLSLAFNSNNVNSLNANKKMFEDESSKFYAWMNKYLSSNNTYNSTTIGNSSSTSNSSSSPSKDDKFLSKKKLFELSKFDYLNYLVDLGNNSSSNFELANYLITFINNLDKSNKILSIVPSVKEVQRDLNRLEASKKLLRKKIDSSKSEEELDHAILVPDSESGPIIFPHNRDPNSKVYKAGILYTHGGQNKQGWHKQWIVLENSSLIEYADWRKGTDVRGPLIDISLCSIKPSVNEKRKNCFEIITSKGTRNVYQLMTELDRESWMKLLYDAGQLITTGSNNGSTGHSRNDKGKTEASKATADSDPVQRRRFSSVSLKNLNIVQQIDPSNLKCCDCDSEEGVEWISLNLLVIFCVQCSSAHRNLGTSISKVRSLKLDNFSKEQISLISQINNAKSNAIFESKLPHSLKIKPQSSDQQRLEFITNKYKTKLYLKPLPASVASPSNILLHGLRERNFNEMLWSVQLGVKLDMKLERDNGEFSLLEYALSKPCKLGPNGDEIFDIAEFLILNGYPLGKETSATLTLSDSAIAYWKLKVEKFHGLGLVAGNGTSSPATAAPPPVLHKENQSTKKLPKLYTSFNDNHSDPQSDKKFSSPFSARARSSKKFIKKITSNTNSHNDNNTN